MDTLLIHLGMTHPDIWMMWAGMILSVVNFVGLIFVWKWRRK